MLSIHDLERHFSTIDPALLEIVIELRNIVAEFAPQSTERIMRNSLSYHDASRGGPVSAGVCGIIIERDHVSLSFNLGAFLPDPAGLLQSDEGRLAKRFVTICSYADAPWDDLRALIAVSAKFDPYTLTDEQIEKVRSQSHAP
jgi:hypothetical protein